MKIGAIENLTLGHLYHGVCEERGKVLLGIKRRGFAQVDTVECITLNLKKSTCGCRLCSKCYTTWRMPSVSLSQEQGTCIISGLCLSMSQAVGAQRRHLRIFQVIHSTRFTRDKFALWSLTLATSLSSLLIIPFAAWHCLCMAAGPSQFQWQQKNGPLYVFLFIGKLTEWGPGFLVVWFGSFAVRAHWRKKRGA